ncbi:MAG: hypothetical protein ABIR62_05310 [Dokdonella sp.]|uniref:hypothetical protein n=1 Tax=Dokdonella sp. TaxID=2291710 RepID=UPI00326431B4
MLVSLRQRLIPIAIIAAMTGCSKAPETPGAPTAARPVADASVAEVRSAKSLELYRTLVHDKSWDTASPVGQEIVMKYPGSAAAAEVQKSLEGTMANAASAATRRRLSQLWSYQTGTESGGTQSTASIYSSTAEGGDRVRLILRRHSAWGQSAYLFGSGKGFECKATCSLSARFDDKARKITAYRPPTGEPALFISDDKVFIAALDGITKLSIDVREKGKELRTLVFEVGGFDPHKFLPLAKK